MALSRSGRLCSLLLVLLMVLAGCGTDSSTANPLSSAPAATESSPATDAVSPTNTQASAEPSADAPAASGQASAWTGKITMYAQAYTPNKRGAERPLTALQELADEYQQTHPNVTIEFIDEEFPSWNDTVRVKAAAGEMYDVFWAQWVSLNGALPEGIAVDLTPYFQAPNPYITDTSITTWQAAMNETIVNETAAPNGAHYNINGDFVATAFFYNQDLFNQAGITQPPDSWPALLETSQKLKDANIPAAVGVPLFAWWSRHFLTDFYADDYDRIAGFDQAPGMSPLDEAVAINKGLLSTQDPRFLGWWPVFKQFTDFWVQDYLTQPPENNAAAFQDYIGGQAAMIYEGSYTANKLQVANVPFGYDTFNFPTLSAEVTEFSTGTNASNAVGGPNAGFQYAISTPQANKTMEEEGKFEAVLDWLQFVGTPANVERIVNEQGDFIPTWTGTAGKPELAALSEQANQSLDVIRLGNASAQLENDMQRLFGLYLSGNASLEEITPQVQQALDRAAQDYASKNNVNFDDYE